jgi:hypothetical protein
MKKQVLSFTEFINEAYSMMNEGKTWDDVKTLLGDDLDKETAMMLSYIEENFKQDTLNTESGKLLAKAGERFGKIISERLKSEYTDIDGVEVAVNDIQYNKLVQGMVYITKKAPIGSTFDGSKFAANEKGMIKIVDLLNLINLRNITMKYNEYGIVDTEKGKAEFANVPKGEMQKRGGFWGALGFKYKGKEKNKIDGSGSSGQFYITDADKVITISEWTNTSQVTPYSGVTPVKMSIDQGDVRKKTALYATGLDNPSITRDDYKEPTRRRLRANKAYFTFVFYCLTPKSIKSNGGVISYYTEIVPVEIPYREGDSTKTLEIEENGILFKTGSSELTENGKKAIFNAITQNFSSVSKIEVTGSASQEGPSSKTEYTAATYANDKAGNLKLAGERANSVVTFLKEISPDADPTAKAPEIQGEAKTDEKTRKTFRKVILNVTGTQIVPGQTGTKIVYTPETGGIKSDLVTIKEIQMTFTVSINEDKAKKKVSYVDPNVKTSGR